ncbi:MAG TPA: hypothetical protein VNI78_11320 [Vicinamibacterales bacterium]|nr:hypothetical protein [Vicinamibacterales bacterium]
MTDEELRAIVRDVIVQHAAGGSAPVASDPAVRRHASHAMFVLPSGADQDGPCLIEPAVPCNHCGYCKSYGH